MIKFPNNRIFGLIGAPRSGKDVVGQYLQESRNFVSLAFADKIKEEYGISKEDFEAAKITKEINKLRQELWDFSAQKKKEDPNYFIELVINQALSLKTSVVITDIRTEDEFNALLKCSPNIIARVYMVQYTDSEVFKNGIMLGSELGSEWYYNTYQKGAIRHIDNYKSEGLYKFYNRLENFFFKEDIMDLGPSDKTVDYENYTKWRSTISRYISQFDIREK